MNKHVLGLALLSALGLVGCGSSNGPKEPITAPVAGQVPLTTAVFDPTDSDSDGYTIPLPNDLLFANTSCQGVAQANTDLTLNIPCVSDADIPDTLAKVAEQSTDPTAGSRRGMAALSKVDGWSATAPFSVKFKNTSSSIVLDAATVAAGTSVRMFQVELAQPVLNPGAPIEIQAPTGPVTSVLRELTTDEFAVELAADDANQRTLRILPKAPLGFGKHYLVVFTNDIKDSNHNAATPDLVYGLVKSTTPISPSSALKDLIPLQGLINAQEAAVAGKVARDKIILSMVFSVQTGDVMMGGLPNILSSPNVKMVITGTEPDGVPSTKPSFASLPAPIYLNSFKPETTPLGGGNVELHFGEFSLPYFSKPSLATQDPGAVLGTWTAVATIPGVGIPNPFFPNLNHYVPVPSPQGFERVPVLVTTPRADNASCPKPANGYPVVIFQHGITRNRVDALAVSIAFNNAPACAAVVSIDQPLHGITAEDPFNQAIKALSGGTFEAFRGYAAGAVRERTFGLDLQNNATGAPFSSVPPYLFGDGKPDASGSWFINLYSLGTTRDNLRQAVSDLESLKMAIPFMDFDNDGKDKDFDATKIAFIGQSLGGIAGTTFTAMDSLPTSPTADPLVASVLNVPGGGMAKLLDGSMAFGPTIRGGLASAGVVAGTGTYEQFLWLAQTIVDSGDPINYAGLIRAAPLIPGARPIPILIQEVVGNGGTNLPDLVVPNETVAGSFIDPFLPPPTPDHPDSNVYLIASGGPLAGTNPLIVATGVTQYSAPVPLGADPINGFVRFLAGCHGSLLTDANSACVAAADAALLTQTRSEMQTEAVSFLISHGHQLFVNPALVGTIVQPAP